MTKYLLLAGAMMISAPVLAQTQTAPAAQAPVSGAQPAPTDPAAQPSMATTAVPASQPQTAPIADPASAAQSPVETATAAAPATKEEQVAAVVNTEFGTYDKDSNGKLSAAEFGAWMVALKTASDPTTKAESAATKTWIGQAFANADKDKNKAVSKAELTGFLAQAG
ncbi:EF-hand domain-containing protein [Sphingomonas sp. PB4P5]|uniref:EF-hand domain-containing protein n=1 Tax=Parasphingomonas puruogangriensis TaxID=3096155 RepID=UPI002FC79497